MSYSNFKPSSYQDDANFRIISKSHQGRPLTNNMLVQSLNKQNPLNDSDIFNDGIDGGVDPSINETIRESIQCSFMSSEGNLTSGEIARHQSSEAQDSLRDFFVMNRMNWITYLKVLFDQLESFNQNRQRHVENANFLKGLRKIKTLLPLQPKNDYFKSTSDVAFSFKEVEASVVNMPKYITWDSVIDAFLSKQYAASIISNPVMKASIALNHDEFFPVPTMVESSLQSSIVYEEGEVKDQSFKNPAAKKGKIVRNEDFFLSFADSVIKMQPHGSLKGELPPQQYLAEAPLTKAKPMLGMLERDDDEACEIDSDGSSEEELKDENESGSKRVKANQLEESVRSSRTATFKSVRGLAATQTVQDSYYATKVGSQKASMNIQSAQQATYYSVQQQPVKDQDQESEDGQVEVGSNANHSILSLKWKGGDIVFNYDDPTQHAEKSTRISSQNSNSVAKKSVHHNNTILSQTSSHSSNSHYQKQPSSGKSSAASMVACPPNTIDIDLQGKGLRNFEIDFKMAYGDKKQLRAINLSQNSLVKLSPNMERSLQFMNVSFNKLKSLGGIETCANLKFLNASGNHISSVSGLSLLQNLREVLFAYNQLSLLKELGSLRNLQLLDLSHNKITDFDKLQPLQSLKKLNVLSLNENVIFKSSAYEVQVHRMFPHVKVLDPSVIKEYSMYLSMESYCFSEPPEHFSAVRVEQVGEIRSAQREKERSKTPKRDKSSTPLDEHQSKKYSLISPRIHSSTIETHNTVSSNNSSLKNRTVKPAKDSSFQKPVKYYTASTHGDIPLKMTPNSKARASNNAGKNASRFDEEEEKTDNSRQRSISKLSRNNNSGSKTVQGKTQTNEYQQSFYESKKASAIAVNMNKTIALPGTGRSTPLRMNVTTPRNDPFNQTLQSNKSNTQEDTISTPSERRKSGVITAHESAAKKSYYQQNKKEDQPMGLSSPGNRQQQRTVHPSESAKGRPITSLKARLPPQINTVETTGNTSIQNFTAPSHPQTVKSQQKSSFVFDNKGKQQQTPGRPSSQLQKFITTATESKQVSHQRANVLPPKSYQRPGEKLKDISVSKIYAHQVQQSNAHESSVGTISSRSLSPVCDESTNRVVKVDLTQFMRQ